jgi:hypothetical protein
MIGIYDLLRTHYAAPTWAFFREVSASVGGHGSRADGIAVAMWRSRGLEVHGIEVKHSRSDWLRELRNPSKAEQIFQYCDRWFLVTPDESVAKPEEIPPTWGWIVARKGKLFTIKKAPVLQAIPPTKWFMCSLVRLAHQNVVAEQAADPERKLRERFEAGVREGEARAGCDAATYKATNERIFSDVKAFTEASGVSPLSRWEGPKIGQAVQFVMNGGLKEKRAEIERIKYRLEQMVASVNDTLAIIPQDKAIE